MLFSDMLAAQTQLELQKLTGRRGATLDGQSRGGGGGRDRGRSASSASGAVGGLRPRR